MITCNDIRALRESLHLTQPEFAKIMGLSNVQISKLETGRRSATPQDIERLKELKLIGLEAYNLKDQK